MQLPQAVCPLFDYPIADILAALPDPDASVWDRARFRQAQHAPHEATRTILFRWPRPGWRPGQRPVVFSIQHASPDLVAAVERFGETLAAHLRGEIVRLVLAELAAGGEVAPHYDTGNLRLFHRCHLPIETNPQTVLVVDGEIHHLRSGTVYEFDNTRLHSVRNGGTSRRIHLLCDVLTADARL